MRFRLGRIYLVPDALSRLPSTSDLKDGDDILENVFHVSLVTIYLDFKAKIINSYKTSVMWKRVLRVLNDEPPDLEENREDKTLYRLSGLRFYLKDNLIYYVANNGNKRLYIP